MIGFLAMSGNSPVHDLFGGRAQGEKLARSKAFWEYLGASWEALGASWEALGASRNVLGGS